MLHGPALGARTTRSHHLLGLSWHGSAKPASVTAIIIASLVVMGAGFALVAYAVVEGRPIYVLIGIGLVITNAFIIAANLEIRRMR